MSEAPHWDDTDPGPGPDAARLAQLHRLDRDHPVTEHDPLRTPLESLHHRVTPLTARQRRTCVFPHCTRDARSCDTDHVTPYRDDGTGGTTSSDNLAALCRHHRRLKTHHPGWTYQVLHPGTYLWTTPTGQAVLRDRAGTHLV